MSEYEPQDSYKVAENIQFIDLGEVTLIDKCGLRYGFLMEEASIEQLREDLLCVKRLRLNDIEIDQIVDRLEHLKLSVSR